MLRKRWMKPVVFVLCLAPVFWLALFGLPGLLIYKAVNTADSMIGHLTPLHRSFGWAAARRAV